MNGSAPIGVRYWPVYRNPYQKLFYGFSSSRFSAQPGDASTALTDIAANSAKRICFHVHWLNFLFKEAATRGDGKVVFDEFLAACCRFRDKGGVLAWTVHNLQEHESPDPEFEFAFRRRFSQIADIIIVHGERAREQIISNFDAPPERIISIAHGSYIGVYDDKIDRDTARSRVGAPVCDTLFVNLGAIRPYKGVDELIANTIRVARRGTSVGLLLAGRTLPSDAATINELANGADFVRANLSYVDDNDLQNYLNAADFMVLPYRSILTSGSAILSLSFARPVVGPAIGSLLDVIDDGVNGFLYDPASPTGLEEALIRAAKTDAETRARMSDASFIRATALRWSEGRNSLIQAISKCCNDENIAERV